MDNPTGDENLSRFWPVGKSPAFGKLYPGRSDGARPVIAAFPVKAGRRGAGLSRPSEEPPGYSTQRIRQRTNRERRGWRAVRFDQTAGVDSLAGGRALRSQTSAAFLTRKTFTP